MAWLVLLVVLASATGDGPRRRRRAARRRHEAASARGLRLARHAAHEDEVALADRLADLSEAPVTEEPDDDARGDLLRAGRAHADARRLLRDAHAPEDVAAATRALAEAGRALAAGWSHLVGRPGTAGWVPCFFNPRHGPAEASRTWAPAGCPPHEVPTCRECWDLLEDGLHPHVRDVVRGGRHVPWFRGGPDYGPWAEGYYGDAARSGRFPSFVVDAMLATPDREQARPATHRDRADWTGWAGDDRDDYDDYDDMAARPRRSRRRTRLGPFAAADDVIQGFYAPDRGRPRRERPD